MGMQENQNPYKEHIREVEQSTPGIPYLKWGQPAQITVYLPQASDFKAS